MRGITTFVFLFFLCATARSQSTYYSNEGVAINGYDAVAYFEQNNAVKGSETYVLEWNNAKWLFSSKQHLDSFKVDPAKYAPQYGGWCAYGVSDNHKAPTQPDAFTITGGKLYLNYNKKVMQMWRHDTTKFINLANQYWPALADKP
jgi:hypothetical protein